MIALEADEPDDSDIVFRDFIMLTLAGFITLVVLLLPHIATKAARSATAGDPPGNVIVEVRWPDAMDSDVDLWVQAPGDVPVGYSNKGGKFFNLLRDDLGQKADATGLNYEVTYSRGMPEGEYAVNLHLYRNPSGVASVPVTVVTSVKRTGDESARQILASKIELHQEGEELTVYRFKLDGNGKLVTGSVGNLQKALRAWRK